MLKETPAQQKRWMVFRAQPQPRNHLPLGVRSVGRYCVNRQWQEKRTQLWFTQLFWTFEGSGSFSIENRRVRVSAGDIFIYHPGETHDLRSEADNWGYCWLTLDHPQSAAWVSGFGLTRHTQPEHPCPQRLFRNIRSALEQGTEQGEREAAHHAHALLLAATPQPDSPAQAPLAAAAKQMIDTSFTDAALNIQQIADTLHIHRSTLFRHFIARYGLTPVQYLGNLRLRHAISLINSGHTAIAEIAARTGFSDPNYLSRRIAERTGMPARKIRKARA